MRRFLTLVCLLCLAIPAGISISGCTRNPGASYCNGLGYGLRVTDLDKLLLQPQTGGISLAYGQTHQMTQPQGTGCHGDSVSVTNFVWGTTNNQMVDISPTGNICAGTWNRNSGGGIPNYTICNLPTNTSTPFTSAVVTATANSVTSNPVTLYVHAPVTSLSLVGPTGCLSQGTLYSQPLDVQAFYSNNGTQTLMCAPNSTSVPSCSTSIGTLSYNVVTSSVATINATTNQITAQMPGVTEIQASLSGTGSTAGYFSTCPPASISISLANGAKQGTISQGVTQNMVTTVLDTNGNSITGLPLDYQSTNPIDIQVSATGAIGASFPGTASIYAICQPSTCNPSPVNYFGLNGNGLSIASNPVLVTTPGTASQFAWYGAPGQSQYIVPAEVLTGVVASPIRLPYVPNSMVMDQTGSSLYLGSSHELMVVSTGSNTVTKTDTTVPGTVLAVAPNDSLVLINDPLRQIFYIYSPTGGVNSSFGGLGTAAAWTPDAKTLYITDSANMGAGHTDTLYVYNVNSGWTTYPLTAQHSISPTNPTPRTLAITVPSVGAYASGVDTGAHTWCPSGSVVNSTSTNMTFYPQAPGDLLKDTPTDVLAATTDGQHILGATVTNSGVLGGVSLTDIGVTVPTTECQVSTNTTTGVQTLSALATSPTLKALLNVNVNATAINQVVPSPVSNLAFITYTNNGTTGGAALPYYVPGSGAVSYLQLAGAASVTAPLAGVFSPDNTLFFVSTAGDNQVHYISIPVTAGGKLVDTLQISPNLPVCSAATDSGCQALPAAAPIVPATVIAVKPRATT